MRKKNILKIILIVFVIFLVVITFIAFNYTKEELDNVGHIIKLEKTLSTDYEIDYLNEYKDNIIEENNLSYTYEILHSDASLYGKVYIDNEGNLIISDDFTNSSIKVNDEKYVTLYRNIGYTDKLIVYALTNNSKLYKILLDSTDINNTKYYELHFKNQVVKFTSLNVNTVSSNEISPVVLCNDNKMYVADYDLLYNTNYYEFYDKYIIFDDNTIALTNGKVIVDAFGDNVKAYAYILFNEKIFESNPNIAIVSDKGELIFKYSENEIYSYHKLIKSITGNDVLKLEFYDDTYLTFKGNYFILDKQNKDQ